MIRPNLSLSSRGRVQEMKMSITRCLITPSISEACSFPCTKRASPQVNPCSTPPWRHESGQQLEELQPHVLTSGGGPTKHPRATQPALSSQQLLPPVLTTEFSPAVAQGEVEQSPVLSPVGEGHPKCPFTPKRVLCSVSASRTPTGVLHAGKNVVFVWNPSPKSFLK